MIVRLEHIEMILKEHHKVTVYHVLQENYVINSMNKGMLAGAFNTTIGTDNP
jgi:hypothetical protein